MIIVGIDPGVARVGWSLLEVNGHQITSPSFGCITTEKDSALEKRLVHIYEAVMTLIKLHKPACLSIEELFFSTNVKTALAVGQSRGVVLLAAAQCNIPVVSYTPLTVKQTICGSGKAEKMQIQRMVQLILKLPTLPQPDDAADALALALTHAYSYKLKGKLI